MPRTTTSLGLALGTRPAGTPLSPALTGARTIMCIGDSITRGWLPTGVTEGGYRVPLASYIATAGLPWTMIGPYSDTGLHGGVNGRTIASLTTAIPTTIGPGYYRPDCIALLIGSNDMSDGAGAATGYGALLDAIETAEPDVRLVVSTTLPRLPTASPDAQRAIFETALPAVLDASAQHADGRMVRCGGIYAATLGTTGVGGDVHPTAAGYAMMAAEWWPSICHALGRDAEW